MLIYRIAEDKDLKTISTLCADAFMEYDFYRPFVEEPEKRWRFICDLHVEGVMICPDSITGEEIEVPFETESQEVYSFIETDEDGVRVVTDEVIDLLPAVIDDILLEVPLQVTVAAEGEYPEGDGWKVYSEAEYQESRKERLDPRLAKLKQFNEDEQ